jgi:hypothetical protein
LTLPASRLSRNIETYSYHPAVFYSPWNALRDLKQAAPHRNGYGMRPIVGSQLVHEVLDVEVNRGLRNRELICNLLVAMAIANESKNLQLPRRKIVVPQVLGNASRYIGRNVPPASMNRPDHAQ